MKHFVEIFKRGDVMEIQHKVRIFISNGIWSPSTVYNKDKQWKIELSIDVIKQLVYWIINGKRTTYNGLRLNNYIKKVDSHNIEAIQGWYDCSYQISYHYCMKTKQFIREPIITVLYVILPNESEYSVFKCLDNSELK